jgi:hypothetical protein
MKFLPRFVSLVLIFSTLVTLTASTVLASGVTWTNETTGTSASGLHWFSITSSSDGTKLAAVETNFSGIGGIWTSTDSGVTWTNETTGTSASGLQWQSITSSADGTKLAAVEQSNGDIWTATLSFPAPPAPAPAPTPPPSGGGGMIVGSGPTAPSAAGLIRLHAASSSNRLSQRHHRLSWCNHNCLNIAAHRADNNRLISTNHDTGSAVCIILPVLD